MQVSIHFYSYFKELTGCSHAEEVLSDGSTLGDLHDKLMRSFPRLEAMKRSTLIAVGVEYQPRDYILKDGDEVALFPPVQGG